MTIKSIICSRRTTYQFIDEEVPIELIEECIESARWAPNHKMRQPWLFWSLGKISTKSFADIYANHRALKKSDLNKKNYLEIYEKALKKFCKIPKVILVGQVLTDSVVDIKEDYAACACAIQNFQLMACELGLGVQWSTGPIIKDLKSYELLSIDPLKIELIGALYIGFPSISTKSNRKSLESIFNKLD